MPHDNQSGLLDTVQGLYSSVEYLHGAGIVDDPAKPGYRFQRPVERWPSSTRAGSSSRVGRTSSASSATSWARSPKPSRGGRAGLVADEAKTRVFHLAYSDYVDPTEALAAMKAALDTKEADRVVLDLRYLRGGNGSIAFPLVEARGRAAGQQSRRRSRSDRARERSAGTVIDRMLDEQTKALFVGEPTPARADDFLCDCVDVVLPASGFVGGRAELHVPYRRQATRDRAGHPDGARRERLLRRPGSGARRCSGTGDAIPRPS